MRKKRKKLQSSPCELLRYWGKGAGGEGGPWLIEALGVSGNDGSTEMLSVVTIFRPCFLVFCRFEFYTLRRVMFFLSLFLLHVPNKGIHQPGSTDDKVGDVEMTLGRHAKTRRFLFFMLGPSRPEALHFLSPLSSFGLELAFHVGRLDAGGGERFLISTPVLLQNGGQHSWGHC